MKLQNQVAVITGSSSNIGEAAAKLFAAEGAKIVVNAKNNEDDAKGVTGEILTVDAGFQLKLD